MRVTVDHVKRRYAKAGKLRDGDDHTEPLCVSVYQPVTPFIYLVVAHQFRTYMQMRSDTASNALVRVA